MIVQYFSVQGCGHLVMAGFPLSLVFLFQRGLRRAGGPSRGPESILTGCSAPEALICWFSAGAGGGNWVLFGTETVLKWPILTRQSRDRLGLAGAKKLDRAGDRTGAILADFGAFAVARLEAKRVRFCVARTGVLADRHGAEVADFGRPNSGVVCSSMSPKIRSSGGQKRFYFG